MKLKNLVVTLAALCGFFIAQNAYATCSNYVTYSDGQVLTSASLNSLQTNYTNCVNAVLDGDTFTGNVVLHSGADLNIFSDAGTTLKASIDGATGKLVAPVAKVGVYNINIKSATTTNAGDSVTVECGNEACSATNPGFVVMNSGTVGDLVIFTVTSDVTILLTGAHWGIGTTGDITGAILRVLAINDNGTLKWGVVLLGGRQTLLSTDDSSTPTDINLPEEVLVNSAIGSATNTVLEIGFFRSNFDDTGGAAEDLWANQTGVGDFVTGKTADGLWQLWNPVWAGVSAQPTAVSSRWSQVGRNINVEYATNAGAASNATSFTVSLPAKARQVQGSLGFLVLDNSVAVTTPGLIRTVVDSTTLNLYIDTQGTAWTAANNKQIDFNFTYEVGPVASFLGE